MVMVSPRLCPQATWEFEAEILVLHHPTTISPRYQAMGEGLILLLKSFARLKLLSNKDNLHKIIFSRV